MNRKTLWFIALMATTIVVAGGKALENHVLGQAEFMGKYGR
jgi:hypothetical protein